jgi:hypothetical protein
MEYGHRRRGRVINIYEPLFLSLEKIIQNPDFKKIYFKAYPSGQKYPSFEIMSLILPFNLYEKH